MGANQPVAEEYAQAEGQLTTAITQQGHQGGNQQQHIG